MHFSETKILFITLILFYGNPCKADENMTRLLKDLLTNYNPIIKPARNSTVPIDIYFTLYLHKIIDINEKNQVMATHCWTKTEWVDYNLQWNASDYGGLKTIQIPAELIWKHDIVLHNIVNTEFQSSLISTFADVSNTGYIVLYEHAILLSSCTMDVSYFPFDIQTCNLQWESWSYDNTQIDIFQGGEDQDCLEIFEDNGEFELLDFVSNKSQNFFIGQWFADITYTLKLKRRPLAYIFNLIIPCSIINAVALLVFCMPSQTGEKVTLGISSLVSMTVFLINLKDSLPATANLSIINVYYGVSMLLITFSTGLSVLTINIYYQGDNKTPLPTYLKRFVNRLSRLIFIPAWTNLEKDKTNKQDKRNYPIRCSYSRLLEDSVLHNNSLETNQELLMRLIEKHNNIIEHQENNLYIKDKIDHLHQEWRHASGVLDRLFLIIFILTTFVTSFVILYSRSSDHQ